MTKKIFEKKILKKHFLEIIIIYLFFFLNVRFFLRMVRTRMYACMRVPVCML